MPLWWYPPSPLEAGCPADARLTNTVLIDVSGNGERLGMVEKVVIVGAGPVGMVLACELLQQGIPVRLVDVAREPSAHSRATIVWPRILELLHHTELTPRIVDSSHRIKGVAYFSAGRRLGTAWMNRLGNTPYPFAAAIRQNDTERIIETRLTELGGKIERGPRLTAIKNADGARPVAVLQGTGGIEEVECSWLVGADGAHSTARKLVGASFEGRQFDVHFAVTDAEITGDVPMDVVSYCYTPAGSLAFGPLEDDASRVAVSVPPPADDTPPSREFFQSVVDERGPGRNMLGELQFSTVFAVHARTAARFRFGRCLLAGDAAHVMSPAGAQGMNTSLQDAINLGWRLGGVLRGLLPEEALDGYDRDRRAAAHAVAKTTALQTDWGLLRRAPQIAVRDVALRTAEATGLLQRKLAPLVAQTGLRYPAAGEPRSSSGARVPVVPVGESPQPGGEWPEIPSDRFTVLLWPGVSRQHDWRGTVARARMTVPADASIVEVQAGAESVRRVLGRQAALAVVRPDGHLFAAVSPSRVAELPQLMETAHRTS